MKALLPIALFVVIIYGLGSTIGPLFIAGIVALLCDPYIRWLNNKGIKKPNSTLILILCLTIPLIVLNLVLLPIAFEEAKYFLLALPDYIKQLLDQIEIWAVSIGVSLNYDRKDVITLLNTQINKHSFSVLDVLSNGIKNSAGSMTQIILRILNVFLVPIFFFYLISEKRYWQSTLKSLIPQKYHLKVFETLAKASSILKSYLQGQVIACSALALIYSLGLLLVGLRFAVLIGIITGSLTFVPYVGFSIGLGLGLLVALTMGKGVGYLFLVFGVFMIGQALESFVITPRFVGRNVGLTSLESILVLIIFGNFFGFVGMIVAIPMGAIIKTAATEYIANEHT